MKPAFVPKLRRDLLKEMSDLPAGMRQGLGPITGRLANADLFLVGKPMVRMALDASRDVPEQTFSSLWPHPIGLMWLDGGLPRFSGRLMEQMPGASALAWCVDGDMLHVNLWADTDRRGFLATTGRGRTALVWEGFRWAGVGHFHIPHSKPYEWSEFGSGPDADGFVSVFSFLLATWHLMQMPTVADVTERTEAGPKLSNGKRDTPRQVKVVELRRLARKAPAEDEPDDESKRTFHHQWVVRGHWRQQRVGKGRSEVRTTWVPSHLKGPEGAPFLPSETVFVWRR